MIWDWNGTLFNDVEWCIKVMNSMLSERDLHQISGVSEYHNMFDFPVINYYKNVGFDFLKEPFEDLAREFIDRYHSGKTGNCKLNDESEFVLESIRKKQITQIILSASEIGNLLSQMSEFDISHYFDEILGISDIYAGSKIDLGLEYIAGSGVKNGVLIGDTEHDFEVANALGIDCLLVTTGHQSRERLLTCGVPVLDDFRQIIEYIG